MASTGIYSSMKEFREHLKYLSNEQLINLIIQYSNENSKLVEENQRLIRERMQSSF